MKPSLALVALVLAGCRSPTEITLALSTDVSCAAGAGGTAQIAVAGDFAPAAKAEPGAVVSNACSDVAGTKDLGTIVLVPSGQGNTVAIEITAGVGMPASACTTKAQPGCIHARRRIGFVPHTPLTLPIALHDVCAGVECADGETCVPGAGGAVAACATATCDDPSACDEIHLGGSKPIDAGPVDATVPDGGLPPPPDAGGPIAFLGTSTASATPATMITIGAPNGVAAAPGDLLWATIYVAPSVSMNAPSSFIHAGQAIAPDGSFNTTAFYKVAEAGEPSSYTFFATGGGTTLQGTLSRFAGVSTTNPFDGVFLMQDETGTRFTVPAVPIHGPGRTLVASFVDGAGGTWTPPPDMALGSSKPDMLVLTVFGAQTSSVTTRPEVATNTASGAGGYVAAVLAPP